MQLDRRFTHLRLRQYPDGGVARLRVWGEVAPDPGWLAELGTFDLVALENGGTVEDASDRFYSPPEHTILPGRSRRIDQRLFLRVELRAVSQVDQGGPEGPATVAGPLAHDERGDRAALARCNSELGLDSFLALFLCRTAASQRRRSGA